MLSALCAMLSALCAMLSALNRGSFLATGQKIYDETTAIVLGLSFRPTADTVFRVNYRRHWFRDVLGNPAVNTAGFQFGLATYF